jgi:uncharacterized membrane protein YcaP (DUF421 family)
MLTIKLQNGPVEFSCKEHDHAGKICYHFWSTLFIVNQPIPYRNQAKSKSSPSAANAVPEDGFWETTITLCLFVILLIVVQYLTVKLPWIEKWFVGKSTVVIENGIVDLNSLKKLRLSIGQLEAKLREQGIASTADVKIATIEFSGRLGYELMPHAKPVTAGQLEAILAQLRADRKR